MTIQTEHPTELDMDRARILSRLVDLNATIADLTSEAEVLKAELRDLPPGDYAVNGTPALRIISTRRFDAAAAAGLLSVEQRNAALIVSYDAAKIRAHLTPVEVDEFMVESGKAKVVVLP